MADEISAHRKPGRKAETPHERALRLQREAKLAEMQVKNLEKDWHAAIGEAVMAEAASDPAFMAKVVEAAKRRITAKSMRRSIAPLFGTHWGSENATPVADAKAAA